MEARELRNLQQAAMTACNLFTCTNGGPHGCRHCRADLSYLLSVIGVGHANILEGLPEPTDALRLTREEWEREQAEAFGVFWDAGGSLGPRLVVNGVSVDPPGASVQTGREDGAPWPPLEAHGRTLSEAVRKLGEALTASAKPARPHPDDMSAEECEAELEAAEARWICFRNYNMWQCPVVVGDERLDQIDVDWRTKERALRAAVRALREHQAAQSRT